MVLHDNMFLLLDLGIDAWITIATVMAVIGVMLLTKVRADAIMLIAIGVLFATGVLDAKEFCSGFSSGTVVVTRKMMGEQRWMEIVANDDNLLEAVKRYIGEAEPTDDITIMTIMKN